MRLTAQIVARALSRRHAVEVFGNPSTSLALQRPELLERRSQTLDRDRLYVGRCDQLPQRPAVSPGATLVMTDSSPRLRWFRERCCVIVVRGDADVEQVFNEVQRTYLRYDLWEETLYNVVSDDASIQAMLDASAEVLDGTLDVVDSGFRLLATTSADIDEDGRAVPLADQGGNISTEGVREFLAEHGPMMGVTEPFLAEVSGLSTLNANLFEDGKHLGCLTLVARRGDSCDEADAPVLAFLAAMIRRAMARLGIASEATKGSIGTSLATLVANGTLDALSLSSLRSHHGSYVCVKIRPSNRLMRLPLAYLRNVLMTSLPDVVAFEHERTCVIAFVRLDDLAPKGERRRELTRRLEELAGTVCIKAGVSDHLRGLESARTYYLQASIALDNGMALDPGHDIYHFQDFALPELLMNALGELPVEAYYTPGIRRIFEHDERSAVSYAETLECLLRNNMNVSHSARELYLHRSTLIERLGRIREAMGDELDDPGLRLRIQLALAARKLDARIRG